MGSSRDRALSTARLQLTRARKSLPASYLPLLAFGVYLRLECRNQDGLALIHPSFVPPSHHPEEGVAARAGHAACEGLAAPALCIAESPDQILRYDPDARRCRHGLTGRSGAAPFRQPFVLR